MKPPVSYYGGKQKLAKRIVSLMAAHSLYCEPFIGGGAVFFEKPPSNVEVVNDTNREVVNFYQIIKQDYVSLEKEIQISLHSRDLHRKAVVIYENPDMFSQLKRAWAFWLLANQSFSSIVGSSWGYDRKNPTTSRKIKNKRESFSIDLAIRLQEVQIECADALRIIRSRDAPESFFYCDPPYINTDCGHYDGYSVEDYKMLLDVLASIEGKFLLSSYPTTVLQEYTERHGWSSVSSEHDVTVNNKVGKRKRKVEMLTANYDLLSGD